MEFTLNRFYLWAISWGSLLFAAKRKLGVSETIPLTTVFLIAAIRAVSRVITLPGPRDALTVPTLKLKRCTWGRSLPMWPRKPTQLLGLILAVFAVMLPVAQLISGQADMGRPAGEGAAVLAGSLITPVATVVLTIAEDMQGHTASVVAGEFICLTSELICQESQIQ